MDFFTEQIVKKKKVALDYVKLVLLLILAGLIMMCTLSFVMIPTFGNIIFFIGAAMIYIIYRLITGLNLEYEYSFTNGSLDVDKIIAARKRKHIATLNARTIEIMGPKTDHAFGSYFNNPDIKKIYACTHIDDSDVYFVVFENDGKKSIMLFNPNTKIKDGFKRFNPQKVSIDD